MAYKTALESMSRKRAALNNVAATSEKLADFSPADPVKSIAQVTRKKIDEAAWTSRVLKLSSVFNAYPEVLASEVEFQAIAMGSKDHAEAVRAFMEKRAPKFEGR